MDEESDPQPTEPMVDIHEVDDVFRSAAGHLNAQHGRLVSAVAWMLEHTRDWQGDGLWTPESYVRWRAGVASSTASKLVAVARRAGEFPECVAALQRGELSLDQIAPVVGHAPGWCDTQMASLAPRCTVAQISKMAQQYPWGTDPASGPDDGDPTGSEDDDIAVGSAAINQKCESDTSSPAPADEGWFGWDDRGRFRLYVEVGADTGMLLENALAESRDSQFRAGNTAVDTVDAVIEMANRSLDTVVSPDRKNRYRANLHIDRSGHATDSHGRAIQQSAAERITCDALLSAIEWDQGVPVSVGRTRHIVPDRTRRIVEYRDGGCRVPGCRNDRFVEVHHIIHWTHGGPTDTANLICLCPRHHRLHHRDRLGITGNADLDSVVFTDANGKMLTDSGTRPEPVGAPPLPIRGTWEHPLGERLELRWLYFNDDPDRPTRQGSHRSHPPTPDSN